jgi:hypothetical protein
VQHLGDTQTTAQNDSDQCVISYLDVCMRSGNHVCVERERENSYLDQSVMLLSFCSSFHVYINRLTVRNHHVYVCEIIDKWPVGKSESISYVHARCHRVCVLPLFG